MTPFAADRPDRNVSSLDEARRRHQAGLPPKDGTPVFHLAVVRDEEREMERREAMDSGDRAAAARYCDGLGSDPVRPFLDAEVTALAAEHARMTERIEYLRGAVEPDSLQAAVVGAIGLAAEEIRGQIRPLRQALKDERGSAA